jgi:hypothetical protein
MKKNFIIEYECYDNNNTIIVVGKMKVKNKETKFEAQCSFENYLKRKYGNFSRLVIIKCTDDSISGIFKDIFENNNPFNNIFK